MFTRPLMIVAMTIALVCCAPEEPEPSPIVEPCMGACGKAGCAGDVEIDCRSYCEDVVGDAADFGEQCSRELEVLFECQAELGCLEYLDWYNEAPGAPCLVAEASVAANCAGIQLR